MDKLCPADSLAHSVNKWLLLLLHGQLCFDDLKNWQKSSDLVKNLN